MRYTSSRLLSMRFLLATAACPLVTAKYGTLPHNSTGIDCDDQDIYPWTRISSPRSWDLENFTSLVTFGDSYTDDSRLLYFIAHGGQPPPPGWVDPINHNSADGGLPWPEFIRTNLGINLYNYAVAGAVCSNHITPRYFSSINASFPSVAEYEVPAYIADLANYTLSPSTKATALPIRTPFLHTPLNTTVHSLWIGTNDLGASALLSDSQVAGTSLVTYVDCVLAQIARLYRTRNARYFVLQNNIPLNLTPLYRLPPRSNSTSNPRGFAYTASYWPNDTPPANQTAASERIREESLAANALLQAKMAATFRRRFPDARFALLDVHGLFEDIYHFPAKYLNATAATMTSSNSTSTVSEDLSVAAKGGSVEQRRTVPLNVTGYIHQCNANGTVCNDRPDPASFMWYDPLHLSVQVAQVVAREFVDVVQGQGKWGLYLE